MSNELTPAAAELLTKTKTSAQELYARRLDPLAEKLLFRLPVPAGDRQGQPMVLVLGNHSAGKSTFINYLLGRDVQKTGVAPTDDGFTVLAAGPVDEERDGSTLVGTPGLGMGELERFGPALLSHLSLKLRAGCGVLQHLWLVDSPGMIDAASTAIDRGFDFFGVLRWFAEAADVILLLFDPEKPGTTGETLTALTTSLVGLDHKLLIVLNKADEFHHVQDHARAYGALCWNLAKVIPRKDLPRIYNCYVPGPGRPVSRAMPVEDFDLSRAEIVQEVRRAPERRIDNIATRLNRDARELLVHARIASELRSQYRSAVWAWRVRALAAVVIGLLPAVITYFMKPEMLRQQAAMELGFAALGVLAAVSMWAWGRRSAERHANVQLADLTPLFERLYGRFLSIADSGDLRDLWERVRERVTGALTTLGVANIPRVSARELKGVEEVIQVRVPQLRAGLHGRGSAAAALPPATREDEEAPAEAGAMFV